MAKNIEYHCSICDNQVRLDDAVLGMPGYAILCETCAILVRAEAERRKKYMDWLLSQSAPQGAVQ